MNVTVIRNLEKYNIKNREELNMDNSFQLGVEIGTDIVFSGIKKITFKDDSYTLTTSKNEVIFIMNDVIINISKLVNKIYTYLDMHGISCRVDEINKYVLLTKSRFTTNIDVPNDPEAVVKIYNKLFEFGISSLNRYLTRENICVISYDDETPVFVNNPELFNDFDEYLEYGHVLDVYDYFRYRIVYHNLIIQYVKNNISKWDKLSNRLINAEKIIQNKEI